MNLEQPVAGRTLTVGVLVVQIDHGGAAADVLSTDGSRAWGTSLDTYDGFLGEHATLGSVAGYGDVAILIYLRPRYHALELLSEYPGSWPLAQVVRPYASSYLVGYVFDLEAVEYAPVRGIPRLSGVAADTVGGGRYVSAR